jgi:hypothetical protein
MKKHMTLTQLERDDWGPPPHDSFVVTECHRLRHVPLRDLTVENLRLLIGQGFSLPYTVPLALEHLSRDPMVSGDFYPGDLLKAVRGVPEEFWTQHPALKTLWQSVNQKSGSDGATE